MQRKRPTPQALERHAAPWEEGTDELLHHEYERRKAKEFLQIHGNGRAPWTGVEEDELRELEESLRHNSLDQRVVAPWDEGSTELRVLEYEREMAQNYMDARRNFFAEDPETLQRQKQEREQARTYKFESLFHVPPMPERERRKIESYKYQPPYQISGNEIAQDRRPPRKMDASRKTRTRNPWDYGSMTAPPASQKAQPPEGFGPKRDTKLWTPVLTEEEQRRAAEKSSIEESGDPILDSLRLQLKRHGAAGIAGLSRKFRIMDDDGNGTIDEIEFRKGMRECKLVDLSDKALNHLFHYFDQDDSGVITLDEFLVGIRGTLNARRREMVKMAFGVLDKDGSGTIDMHDIKGVYNASMHPDVIAERRTEDEVLMEFIESFECGSKEKGDGVVTFDEFERYYANLSASIDGDDYFELMIRNSWHISGGEGQYANTSNRRILVRHSDGRETVEEVINDLGLHANDTEEVMGRLRMQRGGEALARTMTAIDSKGAVGESGGRGTGRRIPNFDRESSRNVNVHEQRRNVTGRRPRALAAFMNNK